MGPEGRPSGRGSWFARTAGRRFTVCFESGQSLAAIARRLDLDRKTVRRCLRQETWQPYARRVRAAALLAEHADYLRQRAPEVQYSAQILFQEMRQRGYTRELRDGEAVRAAAARRAASGRAGDRALRDAAGPAEPDRLGPGAGALRAGGASSLHIFMLTLGYCRRSFYEPCLDETLSAVPRCPRAGLRVLRRPHPRASLRSAPHRLSARRRRARRVERDLQAASPTTGASSRGCAGRTGRRPRARSSRA